MNRVRVWYNQRDCISIVTQEDVDKKELILCLLKMREFLMNTATISNNLTRYDFMCYLQDQSYSNDWTYTIGLWILDNFISSPHDIMSIVAHIDKIDYHVSIDKQP